MDTRQLAAFCEVVERASFSAAAERLGVTQPAVSLQVRALERRLGAKLLDRSGRRVGPTEAGLRLYRGAQRLLALEEQLLGELTDADEGELDGVLEIGSSTGPGIVLALLLCEFQRQHPGVQVALSVFDTQRVVERVAARQLELGVVGAAPRHRGVRFEPFFRDEVILVVPPDHEFAGRTITLDELRQATLIVMQDGAGVRQVIEDELRARGVRLRDLDVRLELGLQESVKTTVQHGYGVTFISRSSVEPELAAGSLASARVEGLEPSREVSLVRAVGRSTTRAAQLFVEFARSRLDGVAAASG
ncbi:MAG TPA: LysR family transcriptional regulator [Gaiellaceae bacterium]|nr:LysR family transcriptional regulator [Gaiellaceae bacterium]